MAETLRTEIDYLEEMRQRQARREANRRLIRDTLNSYGVTFDPESDEDDEHIGAIDDLAMGPVAGFDADVLIQDTGSEKDTDRENTRAPVERVRALAGKLVEAIYDVLRIADQPAPQGRINVCAELVHHFEGLDENWTFTLLAIAADEALASGREPSKGRPPKLVYRRLVTTLARIWAVKVGPVGCTAHADHCRGPFVDLVAACQMVLPQDLRALTLSEVASRVETFAPELKGRRSGN